MKYAPSSIVFESGPLVDSGGIVIYNVPSSSLVQASIVGDTSHFRIKGMVSTYLATVPFDPAENWDLPPAVRRKYQDGTIPWTEKRERARVEGESPIWVVGGDDLSISVEPVAGGGGGYHRANLVVRSEPWASPIAAPITICDGLIDVKVLDTEVRLRQGESGVANLRLTSVRGPDTWVDLTWGDYGDFRMKPVAVFVAAGAVLDVRVGLEWHGAPVGSRVVSDLRLSAFERCFVRYQSFTVNVLPGHVVVTPVDGQDLQVVQGEEGRKAIQVKFLGDSSDVSFTGDRTPAGVSVTPFQVTGTDSVRIGEATVLANTGAPIVTQAPLTLKWSTLGGTRSGAVDLRVTVLPRPPWLGSGLVRRFNTPTDAFAFKNGNWPVSLSSGARLRELAEEVVPAVSALEIAMLRRALEAIRVEVPLTSVPLPGFAINWVLGEITPSWIRGLIVDRIVDLIVQNTPGTMQLCGGMAFAALDFFQKAMPVPSVGTPVPSSVGKYVFDRQIDNHILNARKFLEWLVVLHVSPEVSRAATIALLAAAGALVGPVGLAVGALIGSQADLFRLGGAGELRRRTNEELKLLSLRLASYGAWPIGLIYGHSAVPTDQHTVVAVDLSFPRDNVAKLRVWDNNDGNAERELLIEFANGDTLVVTQTYSGSRDRDSEKKIVGIFCEDYEPRTPPSLP